MDVLRQAEFPAGYREAEALRWLHQEMYEVLQSRAVDAVGIKRPEMMARRTNALEFRVQSEAIVSLCAAEAGCASVSRKLNATMAKDLGLKGTSKYLKTKLDTTALPEFERYSGKERDAVLVAWSCMG